MPRNDGPMRDDLRPFSGDGTLSRRDLLTRTATVVGGLALAPLLARSAGARGASVRSADAAASALSPNEASFGPGLDSFIQRKMREARLPGFTSVVTRSQQIQWADGYGYANREDDIPADPDTVFILASISKTFIVASVMQLVEDGALDLDVDIDTYLPFSVRNPAFPDRAITMRMLLTHTSSIEDRYSVWGTLAHPTPQGYCVGDATIALGDWLEDYLVPGGAYFIADKNFYDERPGDRYHYSNIGADLAAYIVEVLSGSPFGTYVHDHILAPLGMVQSGFHLADISTPNMAMPYKVVKATNKYAPLVQYGYPDYPSGMMRTSASALSIWLRCLQNLGSFEGTQILQASSVREMLRPQIKGNWWQGLILYYEKRGGQIVVGHSGSDYGSSTNMFFSTQRNVGVIGLGDRYLGTWKHWYAARDIQSRLFEIA